VAKNSRLTRIIRLRDIVSFLREKIRTQPGEFVGYAQRLKAKKVRDLCKKGTPASPA
jgi:hypothetical protein